MTREGFPGRAKVPACACHLRPEQPLTCCDAAPLSAKDSEIFA